MSALIRALHHLAKQSLLHSSAIFALAGAAFALGSLLLARVMPVEQFGELSLLLAFFNIFCLLAPAGVDQIAVRHRLSPTMRLLGTIMASGAGLGFIISFGMIVIGGVRFWEGIAVGLSIWAGGLVVTASGLLRASDQLAAAAWIFTGGNWGLLLIGIIAQWLAMPTSGLPFLLFLLGQMLIAVVAWASLLKRQTPEKQPLVRSHWREAPALVGMAAVATLALQLERVIIPPLLGLASLATFSVLASVAIFPFRIVAAGIEFSLTPRLRAEGDHNRRRALLRRELVVIVIVLAAATLIVLIGAPWVAQWITGSRYQLSLSLLLAACFSGAVKFLQSIPRSVLTACGSSEDLTFLNVSGWYSLTLAVIGGFLGAHQGLTGVVLGVAIGSLIGNMPTFVRAQRAL